VIGQFNIEKIYFLVSWYHIKAEPKTTRSRLALDFRLPRRAHWRYFFFCHIMSVTSTEEAVPSLKALASSDARLRRLALQEIFANLSERSTPLTHAQCLQLWRGFFVALYMHDSKSMVSVQNLTANLADQFRVIAGKHAESVTDGGASQLEVFSEAF